jgi:carbon-monoxide dehydrogenase small subunit
MPRRQDVTVKVNGVTYEGTVEPRKLLCDFLRQDCALTGTHVGCEHGVCGACTVLLDGETVRSCLMFAVQVDGAQITTVEGLAQNGKLSPVQQGFWENHGLQCGFCTPGFLIAAGALLEENPSPSGSEIREALSGNICRCTGYQSIVESVQAASRIIAEQRRHPDGDTSTPTVRRRAPEAERGPALPDRPR